MPYEVIVGSGSIIVVAVVVVFFFARVLVSFGGAGVAQQQGA